MIYSNDDPMAILAMELDRTGHYGEDDYCEDYENECPICGAVNPEHFYINDDEECVGCYECLHRVYEL